MTFKPVRGHVPADMADRKRAPMPGGLTRREFDGLREDLRELLSAHPRAKFTIVLMDEEGKVTTDHAKAARYGLTVYEDDVLLLEEYGEAGWARDAF